MWKNNEKSVNKMSKQEPKGAVVSSLLRHFITYPQINCKQKSKMFLIRSLKQTIHISTLLIVVINFYI